jgi:dephospho-CoA kinase
MKVLAVTGQIGAGKSTVCRILESLGALHVDADQIAHEVIRPGEGPYRGIVQRFGQKVLNPDGTVNRKSLAAVVFSDEGSRQSLNRLMHPEISRRILSRLEEARRSGENVVTVEAALLGDIPGNPFWDHLIWVQAPEEIRRTRLLEAGLDPLDVDRRIRVQSSILHPPSWHHDTIENGGSSEDTRQQVSELCRRLDIP